MSTAKRNLCCYDNMNVSIMENIFDPTLYLHGLFLVPSLMYGIEVRLVFVVHVFWYWKPCQTLLLFQDAHVMGPSMIGSTHAPPCKTDGQHL